MNTVSTVKRFVHNVIFQLLPTGNPFSTLSRFIQFIRQWYLYKRETKESVRVIDWFPCLKDATSNTPFDPHYFYQSAWLAAKLSQKKTKKHIDVGSQTDLIAPLSGFLKIEFVDIRPLQAVLPNLVCSKGSILLLPYETKSLKSLSSLHVIEHIGLGRYGDTLDHTGFIKACSELQRVLAKNGDLYISVPVGQERVMFNAHRIFNPLTVLQQFDELNLVEFSCVSDQGDFRANCQIHDCANYSYALGLFHFRRIA
jgi:hypothetical protein